MNRQHVAADRSNFWCVPSLASTIGTAVSYRNIVLTPVVQN